ncbi:unnamed protein product [Clonostachys solani]|uniref:Peptidase M14 domain-containing protein n=1 Tax=Clonostachys solani TaxID=160281 RepID=A0A9N9ZHP3_9HYPO|nr:unnamed protein product [Clonostachys solani]
MKVSSSVSAAVLGLSLTAQACLLPHEALAEREYARHGTRQVHPRSQYQPRGLSQSNTVPIGTGDRFKNGTVAPVGLGVQDRDLESILSVQEVGSAVRGLSAAFPDAVKLFTPPFKTEGGRTLQGAVIGEDPRVFLMSGIHARERGGPDHLIYFISDLLEAQKNGKGVAYGDKTYTAEEVKTALSAGVVFVPLTNPDGVAYDQETSTCWRKNRNTASSSGGSDSQDIGVDLNRNFNFTWDYKTLFSSDLSSPPASDDPSSEVFYGTGPASEPEVQAVTWVMDQYKGLSWFLDLHSYSADILYAWGDDDYGTEDTKQNFLNKQYDGHRGFTGEDPAGSEYKEYLAPEDLKAEESLNSLMLSAMNGAGTLKYTAQPSVGLYPTSGGSNDYALGRYYSGECGVSRLYGLCLEFGDASSADPSCPFYPSNKEYHNSMRQVGAGFMELMLNAAGSAGEPKVREC